MTIFICMEDLKKLAKSENINIVYIPLLQRKKGLWGLYVPGKQGEKPTIYLDTELNDNPELYRLARCILAEELGHHFTGVWSFFKIHTSLKMTSDDEKALRWATNKLIPTNELISLLEKGVEGINLVDNFGVTAWFMYRKMEFLQYHLRTKHKEEISRSITWNLVSRVKISCIY